MKILAPLGIIFIVQLTCCTASFASLTVPDTAAALAGSYVGTYKGYTFGFRDTSYMATAYITKVAADSIHVLFAPLKWNFTSSVNNTGANNYHCLYGGRFVINNDIFFVNILAGSGTVAYPQAYFTGIKQQ